MLMRKFVILRGIEFNNIFWTLNTGDNCHSDSGELCYKELAFADTDEQAIEIYQEEIDKRNSSY